ncbi:unnamed protein product [Leptosia nina]|uniref:Uncharacterized protein n=1 Tax=Leptosia nina TaxID=320188 RepID=A0AAV1JE25_9NEOP
MTVACPCWIYAETCTCELWPRVASREAELRDKYLLTYLRSLDPRRFIITGESYSVKAHNVHALKSVRALAWLQAQMTRHPLSLWLHICATADFATFKPDGEEVERPKSDPCPSSFVVDIGKQVDIV